MNKSMKRFVGVLLAVAVLSALCVSALADGGYTYTVRIFSGEIGTFGGSQTVVEYPGLAAGSVVTFDPDSVVLPADSPYYVRGIRESGRDNNTVSSNTIPVQGDVDYVVAYGIKGALVAYTVNYVDGAGNALAPSEMYYGNAGDKPVVAYLYIDGYEPQAYNLTRTLSDNAADNVFTFVYSQIILPTPIPAEPAPTPYVYTEGAEGGGAAGGGLPAGAGGAELPGAGGAAAVEGEEVPEGGAPAAAGGPAAEAGGEQPATEENAPAAAEQQPEQAAAQQPAQEQEPVQIEEEETPQSNGPQEIIDLDEEDTPLGGAPEIKEKPKTELQQEREQSERRFYIAAGLLGVSLIAIVTLIVLLVRRRKV